MRRALAVLLGLLGLCLLVLVLLPSAIDPLAYDPPPAPALIGPLAPNEALRSAELLAEGYLLVTAISFFGFSFSVLVPIFARDVFHGDARTLGLLMSASGCGSLTAAIFLTTRSGIRGLGQVQGGLEDIASMALGGDVTPPRAGAELSRRRRSWWGPPSFNGAAFSRTRKECLRKILHTSGWTRRLRGVSAASLGNVSQQDKPSLIPLNINA
jgi:hypothetical protein